MLPLQITVAFISPPKKITTKKHVSCIFKSPQQCYHFQWICSPHIKQTNRRLPRHPGWFQSSLAFEPQRSQDVGFFGKAHFQHRMGRKCFRKGNGFNHPPQKNTPPHRKLTKRNLKNLKRMVFPNKESPDLEGFIFKIQCSFFGGFIQLRFHTHPLTLCKMQFTKTFGFS